MLKWRIAKKDRQAPLDEVSIPAVRATIDPICDHLARQLAGIAGESDLTIVTVTEDDRSLSIRLQGEPFMVDQARDIIGEEEAIGQFLSRRRPSMS